ncbi:MAG: VWA domain-containing protein [Candidatus Binatia bacterium]
MSQPTGTPSPPHHHWVEVDAYDRAAFARLVAESSGLRKLLASGSRLLPHFEGFELDLYALCYKLNLISYPPEAVAPAAIWFRSLVDELREAPALAALREQTVLDEAAAGLGALLLGEALLELLKSERVLTRGEMLDAWSIAQQGEEIASREAHADTAAELAAARAGQPAEKQLDALRQRYERENKAAGARLAQQGQRLSERVAEGRAQRPARIAAALEATAADIEGARDAADRWSLQLGGGAQRSSPVAQIELGHQLARNPKLKRMAQLVGRMRQSARALRRSLYERANAEVFAVGLGAELQRLLPPELLSLRQPALRRDFQRRLVEGELFVYALRAPERQGRGPMIVCLDGSSSMAGDKEIWSKAVALTLLDIAARQRRRFRSICFAASETPLQVLDLNTRQRYAPDMHQVFALAEYFPGGGTDFQKPLDAALDCLRGARKRRGDIVLITDGECRVERDWLQAFQREKAALGFTVFAVLIDVGASSVGAVREFSDHITSVRQLTDDATREIFLKL